MTTHRNTASNPTGLTLVLGGTGKTGRRVAARLRALGIPVRAASRSTAPAFDWADRSNWAEVLDGVEAIYISYAPDLAVPGAVDAIRALVALAAARDVQRLVLLSGRGEAEAQACEQVVRDSGIAWTVVRAGWFMQNFSEGAFVDMVRDGSIALPAGEVPEPFVDADDIAEVAVAALTGDGHAGQVHEVTGPRALSFGQLARELSRALGREVRFVPVPREVFVRQLGESGAPPDIVWLLDYLFGTVLDGRNAAVCDGVRRALGRDPVDFADYARRVAASGVWDQPAGAADEAVA